MGSPESQEFFFNKIGRKLIKNSIKTEIYYVKKKIRNSLKSQKKNTAVLIIKY